MPDKSLSSIGNFPTTAEVHAARLLLGSHGIAAVVVDEMLVGNFWQLGGAVGGEIAGRRRGRDPRLGIARQPNGRAG